jgi:uncharacterized protein (TIGR03435 family)
MRLSMCLVIGVAALVPAELFPQSATNTRAFEVASIKPSPPTGHLGYLTYPGGRVSFGHCTLEMLIENALDVQAFQIDGGPGWIHTDRYEIDARVPASSESSKARPSVPNAPMNAEQREMLLTLLADRFQLQFHRETRMGPVYFMVKGNKALKLEPTKIVRDFSWVGSPNNGDVRGDGIAGQSVPMPILADRLSSYLGRPVLDHTGIKGFFDFRYDYLSDDPHPDVISTIITSVEQLGLKLESRKGPVEAIVIDHVEKPSPN